MDQEIKLGTSPKNRAFSNRPYIGGNQANPISAGRKSMGLKSKFCLNAVPLCLGLASIVGFSGCSNTSAYTRVPPPGTWGSASNSYYSLPGNSWTPAAPAAPGAIGSGLPAGAPPAGSAQPSASIPASTKTTSNGSGSSSAASFTSSNGSSSGGLGVQPAAGSSDPNGVRIAVFSDQDADDSQVVPAGSSAPPSTTTVPASQLPWRNP